MVTDSVMGLFADPQQIQQAQQQAALQRGIQLAELDPFQRASAQLYQGGYMAGGAIGSALGAQDPQLQMATQARQIMQGVDQTDSRSLARAAQQFANMGDIQRANALAQQSVAIQAKIDEKQAGRETQLQIARERIQAQLEAAKERGATQLQIAQMAQEGRMQMAQLAATLKSEKAPVADDKAATRIGQNTVFENLIAEGTGLTSEIDKNKDAFSLTGRGTAAFQSIFNPDAPEVKVKSDVDAYLNKARNAYLLAAKGTQTEGDAQRAWAEFSGSLDFSSASGAKRSVERITKELGTQKAANESYLKSRGISSGSPLGTKENPIKLK